MQKAPRETPPPSSPPPPFPSCESPTTCKDETYRGSRRPSSRIRRQMARKKKTSQQIIFNKIRGKGKQEKDDLLVYVPKRHPNTYPRKIIQNTLKIHRYLNNPTKRSLISMSCSRKNRMTGNQLYEANHLYSMNSINYRKFCKKPTTLKRHSKQRRPLILACEKVPICAARWCSLCKI